MKNESTTLDRVWPLTEQHAKEIQPVRGYAGR
jgi:hypothetical protein